MRHRFVGACAVFLAAAPGARAADAPPFALPKGLSDNPIEVPADNPMTVGKIALGKQLFFDKRLSKTKARCRARPATCPRRAGPTAQALAQVRRQP